jgi:hypothetical protein
MKIPGIAAATLALLACAAPLRAETLSPVYNIIMPPRLVNEFTVGLSSDSTDLYLFTTFTYYTSPFDVGGEMNFTPSGTLWGPIGVRMGTPSLALFNPTNAEQFFVTGGSGLLGNDLYTVTKPVGLPVVAESVALNGVGLKPKPTGIAAADGGAIYLSAPDAGAGIYRLPNAVKLPRFHGQAERSR